MSNQKSNQCAKQTKENTKNVVKQDQVKVSNVSILTDLNKNTIVCNVGGKGVR